jgi:hypothetical protein
MEQIDRATPSRAFRMDDLSQRLFVDRAGEEGLSVLGWEVETRANLEALAALLDANGVAAAWGSKALADERRVAELLVFHDPAGKEDASSPCPLAVGFRGAAVAEVPLSHGLTFGSGAEADVKLEDEALLPIHALIEQDGEGFTITAAHLDLVGKIPGATEEAFQNAAKAAEKNCPVSKLMKAEITLTATLEG